MSQPAAEAATTTTTSDITLSLVSHTNAGKTTLARTLLGRDIGALGLPTVAVMEGGYAVDALGANVAAFLSGF